jgi:quercetin dioxygenase-like cupin family protein
MAPESSTSNSVHITINSNSEAQTSSFLPLRLAPRQELGPASSLSYVYSTPPSFTLAGNADLHRHSAAAESGPPYVAFPVAGASAVVYIDFAPNPEQEEGFWHRTQTVDYIVMLEGELELTLDGGEKRVVKMGEVVVQRAAMHKWKNLSRTKGARYAAVLLGAEGAVEGGVEFRAESA